MEKRGWKIVERVLFRFFLFGIGEIKGEEKMGQGSLSDGAYKYFSLSKLEKEYGEKT